VAASLGKISDVANSMVAARRDIPGKRQELPDTIDSQPHGSLESPATSRQPTHSTRTADPALKTSEMRPIAVRQETPPKIFQQPIDCPRKAN
jgi:hypothetical protein